MKQSKYKVKIICGFRKEQEYTINANEAHKAYYLFNHPDKRGTFDDGLAIKGSDISRIVPDYNATMGWNHTHVLTNDDYNELRAAGVLSKFHTIMASAKEIGRAGNIEDLKEPLIDLVQGRYYYLADKSGSEFAQQLLQKPA